MNKLKTFGRVTSSGLFKLSILLFALLLPIVLVFGQPDTVKETLEQSGIYNSAVDKALDSAQENNKSNEGDDGLPLGDPEVRVVVKKAVPPGQLQHWAGQAIDGVYAWLDGNDANPAMSLDFSTAKQNLADGLGNYAVQRAQTLPVCTNAQLQQLQAQGGDVDPFKAVCLPKGFDIESLRAKVQNEVANNSDFLSDTTVNTADLPKNEQGKTAFEQAEAARTAYKWAKLTPFIWAGLAVLFAGLLVLLHDDRRRATFVIGRTLAIVGAFITLLALVGRYLTTEATSSTGVLVKQVQGDFQGTIVYIARDLGTSLNNVYLAIGLGYLAIGAVILLVLRFIWRKTPKTTLESSKEKEEVSDAVDTSVDEKTATPRDGNDESKEVIEGESVEPKQKK